METVGQSCISHSIVAQMEILRSLRLVRRPQDVSPCTHPKPAKDLK